MSSKRLHWFWALLLVISALIGLPMMILVHNNRPVKMTVPTPKPPNPNGWDDFVAAGKLVGGKTRHWGPYSDPDRQPEEWKLPELEAFIQVNKPALDTLRAGLDKPFLQPSERSYKEMHKHNNQQAVCRELARTLCGEARYYEVLGKPHKAVDSLLDCVEFGVILPRGGDIGSGLVGGAIESMPISPLSSIIPKLDQNDLASIANRMERIQAKRVPYSDILAEEGRFTVAAQMELFNKPDYMSPVSWVKEADSPAEVWQRVQYAFANKSVILKTVERYYRDIVADQSGFYTGKSRVQIPSCPKTFDMYTTHDISVRAHVCFTSKEAVLTLLQTEVALRRYHAAHGQYPKSINQLVPKYIKAVPIDAFGQGKPLKYSSTNGGKDFLLYSIGADMKDDGGKPIRWGDIKAKGDYVAGKPE